jgi:hypothetical protein
MFAAFYSFFSMTLIFITTIKQTQDFYVGLISLGAPKFRSKSRGDRRNMEHHRARLDARTARQPFVGRQKILRFLGTIVK